MNNEMIQPSIKWWYVIDRYGAMRGDGKAGKVVSRHRSHRNATLAADRQTIPETHCRVVNGQFINIDPTGFAYWR